MDQEIELRHLRYFVAVAEDLHFGRAAARLHIAQPALSQQVRKLEDLLGYALLTRTSRSVALTATGEAFLQRAQQILRHVHMDINEARSIGRGETGSLNVGFIGSGILTILPNIFERYRTAYPRVQMYLGESFTAKVLDGIVDGSLDAGFLRDSDPAENVVTETLLSEPFIAILPAWHSRAKQAALSPSTLRDESFVFYSRSAGALAYDKPLALCRGDGFRPRVVQEASHWLTILSLVGVGLGVSIAPACVASIASDQIACVPLRGVRERSSIELAYRRGEKRPIVHTFAAVARSHATQTARFRSARMAPAQAQA